MHMMVLIFHAQVAEAAGFDPEEDLYNLTQDKLDTLIECGAEVESPIDGDHRMYVFLSFRVCAAQGQHPLFVHTSSLLRAMYAFKSSLSLPGFATAFCDLGLCSGYIP